MARSSTYDRPLDVKILPNTENSNYESCIKKEVENDTPDMGAGLSVEASASNPNGIYEDHHRQLQLVNVAEHRYDETKESTHPKLVIKFCDLWKNSEKQSECGDIQNELPTARRSLNNKRRRSELSIPSEERVTRSSSSTPRPSAYNREKKVELNCSKEKTNSVKERKQDVWNLERITRSNKNLNSVCESCGMCFVNKRKLLSHKRYYTPNGVFQCTICDIGFSRDFQLARHVKKAHSPVPNEHIHKYKCHLCTDRFDRKAILIAHVTHLHNKQVVSHKRNKNPDPDITPTRDLRPRRKKETAPTRRSQRNVKHVVQINPNDYEIESGKQCISRNDLKVSAGDKHKKDGYLIHKSSSARLNDEHPILDKTEPDEAKVQHIIQSSVNYSIEKSIESTDVQKIVWENASSCRTQISKEVKTKVRRLQERSDESNQLQRSQVRLEIASENVQPLLGEDSMDHSRNPIDGCCVAGPLDQLNKTDNNSGCSSKPTTTDPANGKSHGKSHGKSTNNTQDNYTTSKVDLNRGSEIRELLAHHQFDRKVGLDLSHQVSEENKAASENVIAGNSFLKCSIADINLNQVDDFGGIPESTVVNCKNEKMSDGSCKSVSLKMAASSSNASLTDSSSLDSYSTTTLRNYNTFNDPRIRDVRVLLVKLENMLDLSTKNNPPKSSSLETCSSVKTGISVSDPCQKIFANQLGIRQQSIRKHIYEGVDHNNESKSVTQKNCMPANYNPNVPLDHNAPWEHDKFEEGTSKSMPPFNKLPVSMPTARVESDTVVPVINRESANNDKKFSSGTTDNCCHPSSASCEERWKNFKCLACNRIFLQSSQLKHHLSTAHAGVEYSKSIMCQNVVQSQIPVHSESHNNCIKKTKKHCKNENAMRKCNVGKINKSKSNQINTHDKFCKKKISTLRKLTLSHINSRDKRYIRQHHIRRDAKTCHNYKCDVCGLKCCCRRSLKIHKTRYLTTGNNVCNICGLTFARKHVLVMHMKTAHNPKVLFHGRVRCEICNQGFYNRKFLRIHLAHFHKIKYFQCRVCRIRFDTCRSLNTHRRYYLKNVSYLCSICDQTFECKHILEYHRAQAHNRDKLKAYKYSCDTCNSAFVDELLLQAHIGHFHNTQDSQFEAQVIVKNVTKLTGQPAENLELLVKNENACIYSNIKTNNAHTSHNSQGITEAAVGETVRIHTSSEYKCSMCKLSFTNPYAILNHEWEFSNEGTYTCDVCNRKFMTNSLLKNHKIKHYERNVIRNYECYVCKEDFSKLDHLKMHGLHLHGPQFVWEEGFETANKNHSKVLDSRIERARDVILKNFPVDQTCDTLGLMASNKVGHNGMILLFQKVGNNRASTELLRRYSNEDAYCCDFCKTNFSSASLLKYHITKHAYRAYYSNSSRYLCLICKNKFRTNDILRAHVIHCHTSDREEDKLNLGESGCSNSNADSYEKQISTNYNEAVNVAKNLPLTHAIQNQPKISEKSTCTKIFKSTSPDKERQLSSNVDVLRTDHSYFSSLSREIDCDIGSSNNRNRSGLKSVKSNNSEITSHIVSESTLDEMEVFTIKVEDTNGSEKHVCSICIDMFDSFADFKTHFDSVHVKNKAYLCTLCGKKFSLMSGLKYHTVQHKPSNFVCCGKKFRRIPDFICHKFSHDKQTKEKQKDLNTQVLPIVNTGFLEESDDKSNNSKSDNLWKCEICDEVFLDFDIMLQHWDVCIDKNGLQCDMCRAMFKNLNSLQVHKMTYHVDKQNRNTIHNGSRCRVKGDRTSQTATQARIALDNKPENKTSTANSVNIQSAKEIGRVSASTGKFSKQNELLKYGKVTVKPFAKISHDSKIENGCCGNKQQNAANDTAPTIKPQPEFVTKRGIDVSKERGASKISHKKISIENGRKRIRLEMTGDTSRQAISHVSKSNEQVLKKIPCTANQTSLLNYFSIQDSSNVDEQRFKPNDFSVRFKQNECEEQTLSTSQQNSPNTAQNLTSIRSMAKNSNDNNNTRVALSVSGRKSLPNDYRDQGPLKLPLASSNATVSLASSNTGSNFAYYLHIPPLVDNSDENDDVTIIQIDSSQKPDLNDCSDKLLSSLVPLPLNPFISSTFVVSVPPTSENSCHSGNQKIASNVAGLKSNLNKHTQKRLPTLLSKSSSVVVNPVRVFNSNRMNNKPHINSHETVVSNDSGLQTFPNDGEDAKVPILPATAGTSTHGALPTSHENTTKGIDNSPSKGVDNSPSKGVDNSPSSKSASNKEFTQINQSVRCNYCNLSFTETAKLVEHMNSHKAHNQCPACGLTFSNGRALEQHLPEHKCSTCTKCKMVFFFSDSIAYPIGTQKYCSTCNSLLPLPTLKHNRATRSSGHQIIKCGICMDAFGTILEMTVHFKQFHSSFVCGVCNSKFSTKTNLRIHMQTHGNASLETSQCKTCNKYFSGKLDLAYHELSH